MVHEYDYDVKHMGKLKGKPLYVIQYLMLSSARKQLKAQNGQLRIHYGDDNDGFGEKAITVEIQGDSCEMYVH